MSQELFAFTLKGLPQDAFHVVRFSGTEGLSRLYQFELTLAAKAPGPDLDKALAAQATLSVKREDGRTVSWHGILRELTRLRGQESYVFLKAVLVPRLWLATQTTDCRVHVNQEVLSAVKERLGDLGLAEGQDFALSASLPYPKREFFCQYNESHFAFVSRWLERNGFTYFFGHEGDAEHLSVTDSNSIHQPHPAGSRLVYSEVSGLEADQAGRTVRSFQRTVRRLPREVRLKDYNYRTPELLIEGKHQVARDGHGWSYRHGGHLRTVNEAKRLSRVRAEQLSCRQDVRTGVSNAPTVRPGYLIDLENHPDETLNGRHLVLEVKHEGSQEAYLTSGLGIVSEGDRTFYRNSFAAIPGQAQFRPEERTPWPRVEGSLKAVIDGEENGRYAEIDELGRYKVILPFDLSGRKDGHASAWLRLMTPYAGAGHGMHLPLLKGTEAVLGFYEGDPDQPYIAGAMTTPTAPPVVTEANRTMANITTAGGNKIHMEDRKGSERILLHSPTQQSFVRIGAHNDPSVDLLSHINWASTGLTQEPTDSDGNPNPTTAQKVEGALLDGITLTTVNALNVKAGFYDTVIVGTNTSTTFGLYATTVFGANTSVNVGGSFTLNCAAHAEFQPVWAALRPSVTRAEGEAARMSGLLNELLGDKFSLAVAVSDIAAEKTAALGVENKIATAKNDVMAECSQLYATQNQVAAAKSSMQASVQIAAANASVVYASKSSMEAAVQELRGEMTAIRGEVTRTSGTTTDMSGESTRINGESTNLNGFTNFL